MCDEAYKQHTRFFDKQLGSCPIACIFKIFRVNGYSVFWLNKQISSALQWIFSICYRHAV